MLKSIHIIIFIFYFFSGHAIAAKDSLKLKDYRQLHFFYANDLYHGTDRYLTQMAFLKYIGKWNVNGVRNEWTIQHHVYTPSDIFVDTIQRNDRPYTALFYGSFKRSSQLRGKNFLFHKQISIGVQGKYAFGGPMQKQIHYWVNSRQPLGWNYQLNNAFLSNVQLSLEKGMLTTPHFEYWLAITLNAGTVFNDISIKQNLRLHINHPYYKPIKNIKRNRFRGSIALINELKYVAYNGTLQGNTFSKNNPYRLKNHEIKHWVYFRNLELTVGYKNFTISFAESFVTKELTSGFNHGWSSIQFCYQF